MKNKIISLFEVFSPLLMVLGDLGLFFSTTALAGYVLLSLGCVFGLIAFASKRNLDVYERFHLGAVIVALATIGLFVFTGIIYTLIVALIVLFVIDFLIIIMDLRRITKKKSNVIEKEAKFNEKKIMDELDNIKDEFTHVQIYDTGSPSDIEDLSLIKQAQEIKEEIEKAVIVQDPKDGRFFYKETGRMFHLKGCQAIAKTSKKELKSSNSRTELLAKGYKACKICNA